MAVSITKQSVDSITLAVTIEFTRSMLDSESNIQDVLNEAGSIATGALLKTFDSEGSDIVIGKSKWTSKGELPKTYQTPYGEASIKRHVYQTSAGGATFCPLERDARIILTATPRFAAQVSYKMGEGSGPCVVEDLQINHNRRVATNVVQRLSEAVSAVVQMKEESWSYQVPEIKEAEIKTVGIGLDATCVLMCEGGYRQATVGTIALYNDKGERLHTTYIAATPEYGKEKLKARLTREIERTKQLYPEAVYIGIADGAHDNWDFLEKYTEKQTLDFYHATEYLSKVADTVFSSSPKEKTTWLDNRCHELKNTSGAAKRILEEMIGFTKKLKEKQQESIQAAITYFKNNIEKSRMNYAESVAANEVIGSGITEAACKTIVKQRLCKSGMRWKDKGAAVILSIRTLIKSTGRWKQFWSKVDQYGFPIAA